MLIVRRLAAVGVMTALGASVGAQCLVGPEMTSNQMACCAAAEHDCHRGEAVADCCETDSEDRQQPAAQIVRLVPPVTVASVPTVFEPRAWRSTVGIDAARLKAAPPPKYLLLAVFLI